MQILNIAGYQFSSLEHLEALRTQLNDLCASLQLKGTILLSHEGININLAGAIEQIKLFQQEVKHVHPCQNINFHETYSEYVPFKHLKVKIKNEIITFGQDQIAAEQGRASEISPQEFKRWLDENRDITILDTRNDYEVRFGTFKNAINLHIKDFGEFPNTLDQIERKKPIVMFCTGGIRCEKAALYLQDQGYEDVYQLDGGILGYFAKVGGEHYTGECFIFDERISVAPDLKPTGTIQCQTCQGPMQPNQPCHYCNS